jgi:hypothetical protein
MSILREAVNLSRPLVKAVPHQHGICANYNEEDNSRNWPSLWFDHSLLPQNVSLVKIKQFFLDARIKSCSNSACVDLREKAWPCTSVGIKYYNISPDLREWICTIAACYANSDSKSKVGYLYQVARAFGALLFSVLNYQYTEERLPVTDFQFEAYELSYWLLHSMSEALVLPQSYVSISIYHHVSNELVMQAFETAREIGICQNRLWNLTINEGNEKCVPSLMQLVIAGSQPWRLHSRILLLQRLRQHLRAAAP